MNPVAPATAGVVPVAATPNRMNLPHLVFLASTRAERRAQFFADLKEGDPTAWAILVGAIAFGIVVTIWRKRRQGY